jgi:ATP synthase protein I
MNTISHPERKPDSSPVADSANTDTWTDEAVEDDFKPLSPDEAAQWRAAQQPLSVRSVLGWQCVLGLLSTGLSAVITADGVVVKSVAYGALAVLLPTALMAWAMTRSANRPSAVGGAQVSLMGFFVWEGIKLLLVVALLGLAPVLLDAVNWLALVAGFVVVLKAYGLVLLFQSRRRR